MNKSLPFSKEKVQQIKQSFPTPFHIYDEQGLRSHAKRFKKEISIFTGFKAYFAVKSKPNTILINILNDEGCGADEYLWEVCQYLEKGEKSVLNKLKKFEGLKLQGKETSEEDVSEWI